MKINILFIIDHFHYAGGTETHLTHLALGLNKSRFNPYIVVFDMQENNLVKKLNVAGIPVLHIPVGRYYTFNALRKAFILSNLIKNKKIDIVQTYHFKADTYGATIAKLSGVKNIVSSKRDIGDLKSRWHYFLHKRVNRIISRFIVVADAVGDVLVKKEAVGDEKVKTIYNGVDLERFKPPDRKGKILARQPLGIGADDFVVGTVAWLRPEKNYDMFFSAIEKLRNRIENLKVIVVGGGELLEFYRQYIKKNDLIKQVLLVGPSNDVKPYLSAMDVACLVPGKNEGFSNSILEKMATGLPLIVTDVGGNAEAVQDNFNGYVIPSNDSSSLKDAIMMLYKEPEKRKIMGERSRILVEEHFSLEQMIKNHEIFYENTMNR